MKLLLDTHVWVWAVENPQQLGRKMRSLLREPAHERYVCAVSALEVARLAWAGDLTFEMPVEEWVKKSIEEDLRAEWIPVTPDIAVEAYRIPEPFHLDPADRQIVACARKRELTLVTGDERILSWRHVSTLNARK